MGFFLKRNQSARSVAPTVRKCVRKWKIYTPSSRKLKRRHFYAFICSSGDYLTISVKRTIIDIIVFIRNFVIEFYTIRYRGCAFPGSNCETRILKIIESFSGNCKPRAPFLPGIHRQRRARGMYGLEFYRSSISRFDLR